MHIFQCRPYKITSALERMLLHADNRAGGAQAPGTKRFGLGKTSVLVCLLALHSPIGFGSAQSQTPAAPSANVGAQAQAPTKDVGWPRQITKDGATLVYYQPQIDDWKDYERIYYRVAFSLTPAGGEAVLGVASIEANTQVDKDTHTAYLRDIQITSARFPSLDAEKSKQMEDLLKKLAPTGSEPIAVERLMADLEKSKTPAKPVAVENNAPQIFHSDKPAVLLMVQDKPVLAPIEKTDLQFIVNTNWNLFFDKSTKTYYLLLDKGWLSATALQGPWTPVQKLPKDMNKLPDNENWAAIKKMVPPPPPSGTVPHIFFSDKPAELILFKGPPVYTKIAGTQLLYAANTESNVFVDNAQKQYYVLLSGRWFRSASLDGPWGYAGNDLPKDFAKIPADSPKAAVLASVPGTVQAADAVMLAQIPTTAVVNKAEAAAKVKVNYGGPPEFKPIEGTSLEYASNSQEQVIKVGDLYYLCFQGVWFKSTKPEGPWETADSVPKEIYSIPPSSPVYNVTYVTQTSASDTTVESSYTDGYLGMFVIGMAAGVAISYGTGYYYPPYVYWGGGYPYYRAWPATYGMGAVYRPYYGAYGVGRAAYGPYGGIGGSAWYNPSTGRYGRSTSVQGLYGGRTVASGYNPWTGARGATVQSHNTYAQWGSSAAVRGNQWAQTGHVSTARGTADAYRSSQGAGVGYRSANGSVARTTNGVYAGNDGNVYRKNSNGSWSEYNNGNWNQVSSEQRAQAQQRTQNARNQASQLSQSDRTQASQNLQNARQSGSTPTVSKDTMQGLNNAAQSRQRGQTQTQRFQGRSRGGSRGGGGRPR